MKYKFINLGFLALIATMLFSINAVQADEVSRKASEKPKVIVVDPVAEGSYCTKLRCYPTQDLCLKAVTKSGKEGVCVPYRPKDSSGQPVDWKDGNGKQYDTLAACLDSSKNVTCSARTAPAKKALEDILIYDMGAKKAGSETSGTNEKPRYICIKNNGSIKNGACGGTNGLGSTAILI
jgi:hypothetical protein